MALRSPPISALSKSAIFGMGTKPTQPDNTEDNKRYEKFNSLMLDIRIELEEINQSKNREMYVAPASQEHFERRLMDLQNLFDKLYG